MAVLTILINHTIPSNGLDIASDMKKVKKK